MVTSGDVVRLRRCVAGLFSLGLMILGAGVVCGQGFPNKPIRIVVNGAPGGGGDFISRLIAPGLTGSLGQPMIVDNRPAGFLPAEIVSKALPDGYTVLVSTNVHWLGPLLQKAPYDPVEDFSPIIQTNQAPNILVVHPSLAANSVKELIALAKGKPGALNYGSTANGSSSHIAGELFKYVAGVQIVRIAYKGNGPALIALIGGELQLMFATAGAVTSHVKAGRLRALAITSAQPSVLFPGLPTVAASGLPEYTSGTISGMWAPAGTPKQLVNLLNKEVARALNRKEVRERFLSAGSEVVASSPEQFAATILSDRTRMAKVIKAAGIGTD